MGSVAAVGEWARIAGLALAGVDVYPAEGAPQVREVLAGLGPEVALVVMTPDAWEAAGAHREDVGPLTVVMPP
ncbi:hypothetical protein [Streptomyces sp. NPDC059176]|uniref:hypothetical protein n=1 Tax=unclassified Streptomyces TaxID=2593676 RepID=UPI0036BF2960